MSRIDDLERRLERVEELTTLSLASNGYVQLRMGYQYLRRLLAREMTALAQEVSDRVRERTRNRTAKVQFSGDNLAAIQDFVEGDASLVQQGETLTMIYQGHQHYLVPGTWIVRDPVSMRLYVAESYQLEAVL